MDWPPARRWKPRCMRCANSDRRTDYRGRASRRSRYVSTPAPHCRRRRVPVHSGRILGCWSVVQVLRSDDRRRGAAPARPGGGPARTSTRLGATHRRKHEETMPRRCGNFPNHREIVPLGRAGRGRCPRFSPIGHRGVWYSACLVSTRGDSYATAGRGKVL
jgi:hypothetical protein